MTRNRGGSDADTDTKPDSDVPGVKSGPKEYDLGGRVSTRHNAFGRVRFLHAVSTGYGPLFATEAKEIASRSDFLQPKTVYPVFGSGSMICYGTHRSLQLVWKPPSRAFERTRPHPDTWLLHGATSSQSSHGISAASFFGHFVSDGIARAVDKLRG